MLSPSYSISPKDLWNGVATRDVPQLVDVRRRDAYEASPHLLPGAVRRDAAKAKQWATEFDVTRPIVAACKAGHEMSQSAIAQLRADGIDRACWKAAMGLDKLACLVPRRNSRSRAKAPERLAATAAKNRSHRVPVANPPLSRSASAHSVCRSGSSRQRRARKRWHRVRHQGC